MTSRSPWTSLGAVASALTLAGVAGIAAVETNGSAEAATLKPVVGGLMDRQGFPKSSHTDAVRAFVVQPRWADLQPTPGSFDTAEIDRELAQARAAGMRVKLRVMSGIHAPDWVKSAAGSMEWRGIGDHTGGKRMTNPRWWTKPYLDAFDALQDKLAARYDGEPLIGQNVLCGPTAEFCEPFLRDARDTRNRAALLKAGYTLALDDAAQVHNMTAGSWSRTPVEIAFNPYQSVRSDGSVRPDVNYTIAKMREFRAKRGAQAVLANNSIHSTRTQQAGYGPMYAEQKRLGPPIAYQSATFNKISNWQATLEFAVAQGASSVELPHGYTAWPVAQLKSFAARLAANVPRSGSGTGGGSTPSASPTRPRPTPSASPTRPRPTPAPTVTGTPTPRPTAPSGGSVLIAAAGDIAASQSNAATTAGIVKAINPAHVLTLGDHAYPDGSPSDFKKYDATWGAFKSITKPAPGNHDYHMPNASGYFSYFGAQVGNKLYYAWDAGTWRFYSLNSEIDMGFGSAQETWLKQDLAANAKGKNVLAYFHKPLLTCSSGHAGVGKATPLYAALVAAKADVVLTGHNHAYERFAEANPNGQPFADGVREFVVGTGGAKFYPLSGSCPNREAAIDDSLGVLKMTLNADSYAWQFLGPGGKVLDSGSSTVNR